MKILFISPNSPFESVGGIERYVINLINYYKNQTNIQTFLILPTTEESHKRIEGSITIFYDNNLSIPRKNKTKKLLVKKSEQFSHLVETIIKTYGIDVICAENILFGPPAMYSLRLNMIAMLYKIPLMLRLHMYPETPLQIELTNQLMWDHISCVSRSVSGDCFQKGTDIDKLSTDYLGVNTQQFTPMTNSNCDLKKELGFEKEHKIVLTAARIITGSKIMLKEKGLINLIQAFSKLTPHYPHFRLVIAVGRASDSLKNEFEAAFEMLMGYIKIHNIERQTIVKMFELDAMPRLYRGSDVFVLPAEKNETLGQTFIEAMACGLPVIGAKTGGIPEIITDNHNGYLVPPDDSSILAHRIEHSITDKVIQERFILAGLKTVKENFTSTTQFSNFNKTLEALSTKKSNQY